MAELDEIVVEPPSGWTSAIVVGGKAAAAAAIDVAEFGGRGMLAGVVNVDAKSSAIGGEGSKDGAEAGRSEGDIKGVLNSSWNKNTPLSVWPLTAELSAALIVDDTKFSPERRGFGVSGVPTATPTLSVLVFVGGG